MPQELINLNNRANQYAPLLLICPIHLTSNPRALSSSYLKATSMSEGAPSGHPCISDGPYKGGTFHFSLLLPPDFLLKALYVQRKSDHKPRWLAWKAQRERRMRDYRQAWAADSGRAENVLGETNSKHMFLTNGFCECIATTNIGASGDGQEVKGIYLAKLVYRGKCQCELGDAKRSIAIPTEINHERCIVIVRAMRGKLTVIWREVLSTRREKARKKREPSTRV
ncbi:hypothetical protein OBBRIDRAFT_802146 [Obba rivulosa]|uniref:Uncharacterized protein n=1 Tax=Obba rivulosa TaxID=1052685 RepID=A0A8E2B3F2_9APHY|nr:hypothetical protein OBBRIDRAFT_802146 [Obba rivulosa]